MDFDPLFEPWGLKSLALPNRIVMAPMTRGLAPGGLPVSAHAAYYRRRAEGGVGLILTEGTVVDRPASKNEPDVPHFHGAALAGWKDVVNAVHQAGGRIAPQLWHAGASPKAPRPDWSPEPIDSPSGLAFDGREASAPMSDAAIADTIEAFARSASAAAAAGFDAIELHGAHGYLIDQFFWDRTNRRRDRWGGDSLVERSQFAIEIVKAVRAALGADVVLSLRLSQWKIQDFGARLADTPDALAAWLQPLADAGVDVFHCSQRRFWEPEFEGSDLNFAGWAKKLTGKASITVGMVGLGEGDFQGMTASLARMDELIRRLERGDFDLVAVGRALIANPRWPELVRNGRMDAIADFDRKTMAQLV